MAQFFLYVLGALIFLGIQFPNYGIPIAIFVVALIIISYWRDHLKSKRHYEELMVRQKAYEEERSGAELAYKDALAALEGNPGNPVLRKSALEKGREYAKFNIKYETGRFDEIALRNDIEAAVAGRSGPGNGSQADEVRKLASLKKDGVISQEELDTIKSKIFVKPTRVHEVIALLRGLKNLEREGVLTENEFKMKKWDILSKKILQD